MDKTLDEIISSRPKGIRRTSSRRGGKAQVLGNQGPAPATRARAAPTSNGAKVVTAAAPTNAQPADKIIVSNLPPDVNESQVKELFHTTVGPLKEVTLHYDAQGRSKGVAAVQFSRKGDGTKAFQQYNNRLIDGKRPMKIEIIVDPSRPETPASLASRVAPPPTAPPAAAASAAPRTGGRPRRGRGGARGGARRRTERAPKTAADLDAEMEDYTASSAPAAPAAA